MDVRRVIVGWSVPMGGCVGQRGRAMREMSDSRVPSMTQLLQAPPSEPRSHLHLLFLHWSQAETRETSQRECERDRTGGDVPLLLLRRMMRSDCVACAAAPDEMEPGRSLSSSGSS